jgi:ATP-dependent DNA ligase
VHSKQRDADVFLFAFDLLELNGEDLRQERLDARKVLGAPPSAAAFC